MARQARMISQTGIYHVMLRGTNKQMIFLDRQDRKVFLSLLRTYKKRCGFALIGYCLMGNHVHLLIKEAAFPSVTMVNGMEFVEGDGESIGIIFKRLGVSYVGYFNRKYKRTGHLFQDRYKSEVVDTDAYLLTALRYIHRNPVKAAICSRPQEYEWSSYREYLHGSPEPLVDSSLVFGMASREQIKEFTECTDRQNEDCLIDIEDEMVIPDTDREAKDKVARITGCTSVSEFHGLEREERERYFQQLYQEGVSISQLARISGYSRTVIYRAMKMGECCFWKTLR